MAGVTKQLEREGSEPSTARGWLRDHEGEEVSLAGPGKGNGATTTEPVTMGSRFIRIW